MSNYTKTTDFEAKDSLPSGDSGKIIRGSEFETEFDNIATAIASKSDANNPTFTGTVTIDGLTVNGNTVLGNAATDTVTVTADIASNLLPSADDTYNLGAVGAEWNDLHVDGVAYIDAINFNGTAITATAAELNYVDGVTSAIQTQLDSKANLSGANFTGSIDVSGTVTADGLTVNSGPLNQGAYFISTDPAQVIALSDNSSSNLLITDSNGFNILTGGNASSPGTNANRAARFYPNNDIGFYEDTGTTAKLFWDASAERLGLGTSSPTTNLDIAAASSSTLTVRNTSTISSILLANGSSANQVFSRGASSSTGRDLAFVQGTTEAMRIDASGNVGIGTSSPARELSIGDGTGSPNIQLLASTIGNSRIEFGDTDDSDAGEIQYVHSSNHMQFTTNGSEAMRITSAGNVGIGTDSPEELLHTNADSSGEVIGAIFENGTNAGGTSSSIRLRNSTDNCSTVIESNRTGANFGADFVVRNSDGATGALQERFRITEAGNVGIGTSSPTAKVHSVSSSALPSFLADGGTGDFAVPDGQAMQFAHWDGSSTATERMRIDSSGNLLVSGTEANPAQNNTTDAISLHNAGLLRASTTNAASPLDLNVKSREGDIATFRKDGTTVGSIRVDGGDNIVFAGKAGNTKGIYINNTGVHPSGTGGSVSDNAVDLGFNSGRWKNLYLSGGVVFGTTGGAVSSKTLDDYEEGTFTPTLFGATTAGTPTYTNQSGNYTKIGNTVRVQLRVSVSAISGVAGSLRIGGLPFTSQGENIGSIMLEQANWPTGTTAPAAYNSSSTNLQVFYMQDDAGWTQATLADEAQGYIITMLYRTAA